VFLKQWSANAPIPGTLQTRPLGDPAIAIGPNGEAVVVWHDDRDGDNDVYASWMPPGGSWSAPEQVNSDVSPPAQQRNPDVAISPAGVVYAAWEDDRGGTPDIFWSQRVPDTAGWRPAARVHSDATGAQAQPALAVDRNGVVYATWVDRRGSQAVIVAAQMAAGSTTWGLPSIVGSFPPGSDPAMPDIAVDTTNTVHVAWEDARDAAHGVDIYHSLRYPGGTWSPAGRVNDDTGNAAQQGPRLASWSGFMAAAWEDARLGNPDIFLAWLATGDNRWTPNRRVNSDEGTASQTQPDLALDRNGNAYIVWTDERDPATAPDIYFRFIPSVERFRVYLGMIQSSSTTIR
jgi:hypothetical protein